MDERLQSIIEALKDYNKELDNIYRKAVQYDSPDIYGDDAFERWKERLISYIKLQKSS